MTRTSITDAKRLSTRIPIPLMSGDTSRVGLNPSVATAPDGGLIVCLRTLPTAATIPGTTGARTINKLGRIDNGKLVIMGDLREPASVKSLLGCEDIRLFFRGDQLHGVASVALTSNATTVGVAKADVVSFKISLSDFSIVEEQVIASPRYERNWMPILGDDRFVYSTDPLVLVSASSDIASIKHPGGVLRGGSQVVTFGGKKIAVVHEVAGGAGKPVEYTHRFAAFSDDMKSAKVGKPFFFQKRGIEFCAGLAVVRDGASPASSASSEEHLWISYGVEDKRAFLAEVPADTLKEFLP